MNRRVYWLAVTVLISALFSWYSLNQLFPPSSAAAAKLQTLEKVSGYCERGGQKVSVAGQTSTTTVQKTYPSCRVTVYLTGTSTTAGIYSTRSAVAKSNPFTADATGKWEFYAEVGIRVDIQLSGGTAPNDITTPFTWATDYTVGGQEPSSGGGGTITLQNQGTDVSPARTKINLEWPFLRADDVPANSSTSLKSTRTPTGVFNAVTDLGASGDPRLYRTSAIVGSGATSVTITGVTWEFTNGLPDGATNSVYPTRYLSSTNTHTFRTGQGIRIPNAGPGGIDLVATITGVSGNTITFAPATSASGADFIQHDDTAALQNFFTTYSSGVLDLADGFYPISSYHNYSAGKDYALTIPQNSEAYNQQYTIRGNGKFRSGFLHSGPGTGIKLGGQQTINLQLRGLYLTHANRYSNQALDVNSSAAGLYLQSDQNSVGIPQSGATGIKVEDCLILGWRYGVIADNLQSSALEDVSFYYNANAVAIIGSNSVRGIGSGTEPNVNKLDNLFIQYGQPITGARRSLTSVATTGTSRTVTVGGGGMSSTDLYRLMYIPGAGIAGTGHYSIITAVNSSTEVVLSQPPYTTVSSVTATLYPASIGHIYGQNASNLAIKHSTFQGSWSGSTDEKYGVLLENSYSPHIDGLWIEDVGGSGSGGAAIRFNSVYGASIDSSSFKSDNPGGYAAALILDATDGVKINGSYIGQSGSGVTVYQANGSRGLVIDNTTIANVYGIHNGTTISGAQANYPVALGPGVRSQSGSEQGFRATENLYDSLGARGLLINGNFFSPSAFYGWNQTVPTALTMVNSGSDRFQKYVKIDYRTGGSPASGGEVLRQSYNIPDSFQSNLPITIAFDWDIENRGTEALSSAPRYDWLRVKLYLYNSTSVLQSTQQFEIPAGSYYGAPVGQWRRHQITSLIPTGTARVATVSIESATGSNAGVFRVANFKLQLGQRVNYDFDEPITENGGGTLQTALMAREINTPSAPPSDTVKIYAKDVAGVTRVYYQRSDSTEVEMGAATSTGTVTNIATSNSITGGPITSTGTIQLVNDSASPGNSKYYGTDSGGTKGWFTLPGGGGSSLPVVDTTSIAKGSVDATKEVRFEVDGLTTGTVRVITVPDVDGTLTYTAATQTLNNKTLGSGTKVSIGSDATYDTYYRDGSGNLARLANGGTNYLYIATGSGPAWSGNIPAISGGSTITATYLTWAGSGGALEASSGLTYNDSTGVLKVGDNLVSGKFRIARAGGSNYAELSTVSLTGNRTFMLPDLAGTNYLASASTASPGNGCAQWASGVLTSTGVACPSASSPADGSTIVDTGSLSVNQANTFNWTAAHTFKTNIGTSGSTSTTPTAVVTLSPNTAPGSGNYKVSPSLILRAQVNDTTNGLFQTGFRMYTLVGDTSGNATYDLQYNNAFLGSSWTSVFKADQSGNVTIPGTVTQGSYTDLTRISAPSNPSSGLLRLFANNSTGKLGCLDSSGVNCFPSATVGVAESYLPIPSTGLLAWWDVSKLGAAEGESQPTLTDQSGNGYDLSSSGANRPTYTRTQAGPFPALYFDGTDDGMSNGSIATDRRALTTISVIRPLRSGVQNTFLALGSNQFRLQHKDTVVQLYNGASNLFSTLSGSQIPVYDDWQIVTTTHDASLSYAYRGPYTYADGALTAGSMTGAALGRDDASGTFFQGYVAEVIVYNRVLSLTERMQVEARLRAKYGIEQKPDTQSDLVAYIGNSLLTSFNLTADTSGVPAQTNKAIDYPFKVKNFGIGNFATPQLTSVTAHANYINSYYDSKRRKNVAVVWEVTNDLVNNSVTATTAYNNLVSYCQALQTAGWKVIVMTVLHRSNDATLNGKIDTVNASIRTNWPTFADALADVAAVANLSSETNATYFQVDQVHLTAAGNTEVKTVLAPQILKILAPAALASKLWLPAAGCVNATAGSMWDLPVSTPAAAACVTGTNIQKGVLDYADTSGGFSAQNTLALPSDWVNTILPDVNLYWTTSATSGNAKWTVAFVCTDVAATATDDPAFPTSSNGFNTVTTAAPGTANRVQTSTITSATLPSSCVSNTKSLLHVKVFRDGADAADTIGATARLLGVELTFRRSF